MGGEDDQFGAAAGSCFDNAARAIASCDHRASAAESVFGQVFGYLFQVVLALQPFLLKDFAGG
jgi:hypothetical protein